MYKVVPYDLKLSHNTSVTDDDDEEQTDRQMTTTQPLLKYGRLKYTSNRNITKGTICILSLIQIHISAEETYVDCRTYVPMQ